MSSFNYLFIFGTILFISISLTNAVNLDISCTDDTECGGIGALCTGSKCQCETPWYTPCNRTQCNAKAKFVYEGQKCRTDVNCLDNAVCNNTAGNLCRCKAGFTAINGLCRKSLNSSCTIPSECWSDECRDSVCKCRSGFIPKDGNRCQRKLAKIYSNWTDANATGDFCYEIDSSGCRSSFAICQLDSQHLEKFCQCPLTHTLNYEKQTCVLITFSGLSPSNTTLSDKGCGKCKDKNAVCALVGNQTTCWCRAGYIKMDNNTCGINRTNFIFPNSNNINQHNYSSNCSINADNITIKANNELCTCAPGYKFVNKTSSCQPIKPEWIDENFEYGVCTRINSNGAPVQEDGLCPAPLKCEPRQDKYVCSCGRDQYLDEQSNSCYYFLERNLTAPINGNCPLNSNLTDTKCQCSPNGIFTMSADKKRCELTLSVEQGNFSCGPSNSIGDNSCKGLYRHATFCKQGECRCMSNSSYYENNTCVTLIHADPGINGTCPDNAQNIGGLCRCNTGYRVTEGNRNCVQKVQKLNEAIIISPGTPNFNVTSEDCTALFPGQPVNVTDTNNKCVCDNGAFDNNNSCAYYLGYPLPRDNSRINCIINANVEAGVCKCKPGYENKNNVTCVNITDTVYEHNVTTGVNITGINDSACRELFGYAAEATRNDGYCICANNSVAFWDNNKCYFLVETMQSIFIQNSTCPPNSENVGFCKCRAGYQAISLKRGCERKSINSSSLQSIDINKFRTPCNNITYTNQDCESLHGVGAVCRNNTCYCDRSQSFVQDNKCVLFTKYVFPGTHERHLYTCNSNEDCGTNADENGVKCGFIDGIEQNYKVCQCKTGYVFNPIDSTCVKSQCYPQCLNTEECQDYKCVCKAEYYQNPTEQCVPKVDLTLNLHGECNSTLWNSAKSISEALNCSTSCERIECSNAYHDDGSKCVKNSFDDYCILNPIVCPQLSSGFECSLNDNKCTCSNGYYQEGVTCVLPVDAPCNTDTECGTNKKCIGQLCECDTGKVAVDIKDAFDRVIQICITVKDNGVDQIRFSPVLFLFFILARIFFG